MAYLFTSESVSEGHPDKVADQISDALIDHFHDHVARYKCPNKVLIVDELPRNTFGKLLGRSL